MIISILKLLLLPFSIIYGIIMWLRNKFYDKGWFASAKFNLPIIAVGNLSTGGTGKTPHIEYLIRLLKNDFQLATMSRGYKRRTKGFLLADEKSSALEIGDEPMQFHLKFPEIVVSVSEDRLTGIPELLAKKPATASVLLDDAFQHRSVKPGLNILITDYSKPFYNDFILPYGRLREQRNGYKRAQIIIVSKCPNTLSVEAQNNILKRIQPLPNQQVYFTTIKYGVCFDFFTYEEVILNASDNVVLICGIAKPAPLLQFVQNKVSEVKLLEYPDHHYFSKTSINSIVETCKKWESKNPIIITTEKDATRLALFKEELKSWNIKILVLPIEIEFLNKKQQFDEYITSFVKHF